MKSSPLILIRSIVAVCCVALGVHRLQADLLLIPDSGSDRVWAFDPFDGQLINNNFIAGTAAMVQPINAIDSGLGTILVSDETSDAVYEFSQSGTFLNVFASAADGIDGAFGLARQGSQIYITSTINGRIIRKNNDGTGSAIWASGLGTPRDIVFRNNDLLVSESGGDDIIRLDNSGAFLGIWHNSDGVSGIDFPQQLFLEQGGEVLAAGFSPPFGIYQFDANGNQLNAYTSLITSPRGVYRLGNGNILYAGGTRIMSFDPNLNTEVTIVNQANASFRFIELSSIPEPGTAILIVAAGLGVLLRRPRKTK